MTEHNLPFYPQDCKLVIPVWGSICQGNPCYVHVTMNLKKRQHSPAITNTAKLKLKHERRKAQLQRLGEDYATL